MNELTNTECVKIFFLAEKIMDLAGAESKKIAINALGQSFYAILRNCNNKEQLLDEFIFVLKTLGEEDEP